MLECQKHLFNLPEDHTYINCAYMSPLLKSVAEAGRAGLSQKLLPFTIKAHHFFEPVEELKQKFATLIGSTNAQRIALIPSASYGLATVAKNITLNASDNIIVLEEQFPSNFYSWERLAKEAGAQIRIIGVDRTQKEGKGWNEKLLDAIDENTALVAIGNIHWADGTLFDLSAIRKKTWKFDALLIIDGTQSVGALPINVEELQPDAIICAGYKFLLGHYALGLAYYGPYFDEGVPIEENWINRYNSENFQGLVNYESRYKPYAGAYNMGEQSNFALLPMLSTAIDQLLAWGVPNIQDYCKAITQKPVEEFRSKGCWIEKEALRCGHLFGILIPAHYDLEKLKSRLVERKIHVSLRGKAIRVSPHVYNTEADLYKLLDCFNQ